MINFTKEDRARIKETYAKWWTFEQPEPIISIRCPKEPDSPPPKLQKFGQHNCTDFSLTAEDIIESLDYGLRNTEYLGGAFPAVNFDFFGPGVVAAFCGATLDNSSGRVWFHPEEMLPIKDLHIEYDPKNKWVTRIKDIYHAGNKKWQGSVIMGMTDLGGILDIAATFRTTEELMFDLYDEPAEVKRLCNEIQTAWLLAYNDLLEVLSEYDTGFTNWGLVHSATPCYIPQCDFAFMIGNDMFKEFALEDLRALCNSTGKNLFHLDGVGMIPHVDDLLTIKSLNAIQWIPGAGAPRGAEWMDLYKKIKDGKKSLQLSYCDFDEFCKVCDTVGQDNIQSNWTTNNKDFIQKMKSTFKSSFCIT